MEYLNFIKNTLSQSSEIARKYFGKVSSTIKAGDNNQVLSETDLAIGKNIVEAIQKVYPKHNIIDEEAGVINKGSLFTWVVDPIDGTSNFSQNLPTYGVMLGLLKEEMPIAGGIALPSFSEVYLAEKDGGAYCNHVKVSVSSEKVLLNSLIAYGIDGHQENPQFTRDEIKTLGEIVLGIRNLRTTNSAYDMGMVIKGLYGAYVNKTSKIWDNVAFQIIAEEAGGLYTDYFGNKMDYSDPLSKAEDNFTVCVANPELHKQLQNIIHRKIFN